MADENSAINVGHDIWVTAFADTRPDAAGELTIIIPGSNRVARQTTKLRVHMDDIRTDPVPSSLDAAIPPELQRVIDAAREDAAVWRDAWAGEPEEKMRAEMGETSAELMDAIEAYDAANQSSAEEVIDSVLFKASNLLGGWSDEAGLANLRNQIAERLRSARLLKDAEQ